MGKYMKNSKIRRDFAVKDVSQSSLGVRTRAKTLAIQRLQSSAQYLPPNPELCFLELRSRRLEKPKLVRQNMQDVVRVSYPRNCAKCLEKEGFGSGSGPKEAKAEDDYNEGVFRESETGAWEIEGSFGENNMGSETGGRDRSTRESTPCSLVRAADSTITPGSRTRFATLSPTNQRVRNNRLRNMPTEYELEDFFVQMEEAQRRNFIKKYNFDVVNDEPLPGRYIWEKLST